MVLGVTVKASGRIVNVNVPDPGPSSANLFSSTVPLSFVMSDVISTNTFPPSVRLFINSNSPPGFVSELYV